MRNKSRCSASHHSRASHLMKLVGGGGGVRVHGTGGDGCNRTMCQIMSNHCASCYGIEKCMRAQHDASLEQGKQH